MICLAGRAAKAFGSSQDLSSGDVGAYSYKHFGMLLEKTVSFVKRKYGSCKAPEQDRVLI